ncbi:MAG: hypothetical protein L6R40_006645 [Gallowayella cf. fulva]|nr:MAG: hypothetical protein L6R40_006645 [Xanthomendoza cf. fulva]
MHPTRHNEMNLSILFGKLAFLFLALISHALSVTLTITAGVSTSTGVKCSTNLGTKTVKSPVPTTTVARTPLPDIILVISASTPVTTVTPNPVTATTTRTVPTTVTTTLSGMTEIFSTTSTITVTNIITDFSTLLTTVASTSSTTTTVTTNVPAPAGFVGVDESSGDEVPARVKARRGHMQGFISKRAPQSKAKTSSKTYPVSVTCVKTVQLPAEPPTSSAHSQRRPVSTNFSPTDRNAVSYTEVPDAVDPYQCCVACLLSPIGCYGSGFFRRSDIPCNLFERRNDNGQTDVCDNPNYLAGEYVAETNLNSFNVATYSNEPCGVVRRLIDDEEDNNE